MKGAIQQLIFPTYLKLFDKKAYKIFVFQNYCHYICECNKQKERFMYNHMHVLNSLQLVVLRR